MSPIRPSPFMSAGPTIEGFLASLRPAPLAPALRAQVLAALPEGDLQPSRRQKGNCRRRTWSDGIAVLTLEQMGIDPERLVSVEKQTHYNQVRDAVARVRTGAEVQTTAHRYVRLEHRAAFIRAVARLRWAQDTASRVAATLRE
jgi:hypothetical protein